MPVVPTQLSLMVGAAGHSWWHYFHATDSLAAIAGANYFGPAANIINRGDFMAQTSIAATGGGNAIAMCASSDGIANVTMGAATPMAGEMETPPPPPPGEEPPPGDLPPPPETVAHGRHRASR